MVVFGVIVSGLSPLLPCLESTGKQDYISSMVFDLLTRLPFYIAFSGILDIVFAFLPWKILYPLQMKPAQKLGVCVAMSMGVL